MVRSGRWAGPRAVAGRSDHGPLAGGRADEPLRRPAPPGLRRPYWPPSVCCASMAASWTSAISSWGSFDPVSSAWKPGR